MALGLAGYLVANAELFGALLFGLCPLLILAWAFANLRPPDRVVARLTGCLLAGAVLAAAVQGVQIVRVHDVQLVRDALLAFEACGGVDGVPAALPDA